METVFPNLKNFSVERRNHFSRLKKLESIAVALVTVAGQDVLRGREEDTGDPHQVVRVEGEDGVGYVDPGSLRVVRTDVSPARKRRHSDGVLVQDWHVIAVAAVNNSVAAVPGRHQACEHWDEAGGQNGLAISRY